MNATSEGTTEQAKEILHHHAVLRRGLEERVGALGAAVEHGTAYEEPLPRSRSIWQARSCPMPSGRSTLFTVRRSPRPAEASCSAP